MNTIAGVRHWIRGRFILEAFRTKTSRFGILLSEQWVWGDKSGWKLALSVGTRRLILRRF